LTALRIDTAEKVDDEFVDEATLAFIKEVVERLLEVLEDARVLYQIRLHLGRDLMIEIELFDDQVEIVQEGLLDVLADVIVQRRLDVERSVRLLNLLDPHIQLV
jgi:hypothetical protein